MYHVKATFATTGRILKQLSHDHRTVALIFVVPCLLLALLRWMFDENMSTFNAVAPALLAIFPFTIMFIITSITTLRERTGGTMERLMALPIGKLDLVLGYMMAFGLLAIIQATLASLVLLFWLGLDIEGPSWFLIVVALTDALLGTALGIFVSAFFEQDIQFCEPDLRCTVEHDCSFCQLKVEFGCASLPACDRAYLRPAACRHLFCRQLAPEHACPHASHVRLEDNHHVIYLLWSKPNVCTYSRRCHVL